jgi:hypothetical protein
MKLSRAVDWMVWLSCLDRLSWMDRLSRAIAWRLPRRIVYWCGLRMLSWATMDGWSSENVDDVSFIEGIKRWERKG